MSPHHRHPQPAPEPTRPPRRASAALTLTLASATALAATAAVTGAAAAPVSAADRQFIDGLETAPGLHVSLFAGRDQAANPVALALDEASNVYLAETMRFRIGGVDDLRDHSYFFDDDMQIRTLDDRVAMYRKWAAEKRPFSFYSENSERVAFLRDTDGDGLADQRSVFADGFDDPLDGTIAGLLADGPDVYVTCIPSLWKLTDADRDGVAESRESLARGFGLRLSLSGHDLHGVVLGPDGRLYFTLGDRGFNVTTREGNVLNAPYDGGLFRCERDGSNLELYHHGLRNPQEIAFDDFGRLFTVDNNGDMGDGARISYLIEGGHTGWHAGWQVHQTFTGKADIDGKKMNPWMEERMWEPYHDGQPAYLTPCIANLTNGPGGLAVDPGEGSGLPDRYRGWFFICDYTGGTNSGIHAFSLAENGAGFDLADTHKLVWGVAVTDCDFGYDGNLYFSDYIGGWHKEVREEGRVFKAAFEGSDTQHLTALAGLSASDIGALPTPELARLLAHPDRRIRQRAQFALAAKDEAGALSAAATDTALGTRPRLHGLWGLGQIARSAGASDNGGATIDSVRSLALGLLTRDADPHLRAQAAVLLGEIGNADSTAVPAALSNALSDPDPHVRAMAAIALGKTGGADLADSVLPFVERTGDTDPWLRHAATMTVSGNASETELAGLADHASPHVRMAAVIALRRVASPALAEFAGDSNLDVAAEAIRAIYDLDIGDAMDSVADQIVTQFDPASARDHSPLTLHRIVRANFRLGGNERAAHLARFATLGSVPDHVRLEAIECLADWAEPHPVDRVVAKWWPLDARPAPDTGAGSPVAMHLKAVVFGDNPGPVQAAAARTATALGIGLDRALLAKFLSDPDAAPEIRLFTLETIGSSEPAHQSTLQHLLGDPTPAVRIAAFRALAPLDPDATLTAATAIIGTPARPTSPGEAPTAVRQAALRTTGSLTNPEAAAFLVTQLDQLASGDYPPALELDLLDAARTSTDPDVGAALAAIEAKRSTLPLTEQFAFATTGGDPEAGREVFTTHTAGQCTRCHKVESKGGTAGPDLSGVGKRLDRTTILRSLVEPSAEIAAGFGTVAASLASGESVAGYLIEDSDDSLTIKMPDDGTRRTIPKSEITSQSIPVSAMPPMAFLLTHDELRNLVAYLTTLTNVEAEDVVH